MVESRRASFNEEQLRVFDLPSDGTALSTLNESVLIAAKFTRKGNGQPHCLPVLKKD